jgi:hypothetical protein
LQNILAILLTLVIAFPAAADEADVLMVKATQSDGLWSFDVTVHHPDASSEHMLDSIAIFSPDEVQLATADIPKPSIGAESVTTQLNDIIIAEGVEFIIIRGHCNSDGWSQEGIIIALM